MASILLQFSTETDAISRLIRWYTWGPFSHVDLMMGGSTNLLGARMDGGVQIRPWNYAAFSAVAVMETEVTDAAAQAIYSAAKAEIGKPYDLRSVFGMAIRRDWQGKDRWFCSELVAYAFQAAGVPLLNAAWLDRVSPRDLLLSPLLRSVAGRMGVRRNPLHFGRTG